MPSHLQSRPSSENQQTSANILTTTNSLSADTTFQFSFVMCIAADIKLFCCEKEWRPVGSSQYFKPPILFFCPEAILVQAEADKYDVKLIELRACPNLVRGIPPADPNIEVPTYPGRCDNCLTEKPEDARERATKAADKYAADMDRLVDEKEEEFKAPTARAGIEQNLPPASLELTLYRLVSCRRCMWGWASMALSQLLEDEEESNTKTLGYFTEQCSLLEELAKRKWYNERMGYRTWSP